MQIEALPAFTDNYLWLLHDGQHAAVVDPGDASVVEAALLVRGLSLTAILITHHHADHIGGLATLKARHSAISFGPDDPRIAVDVVVDDGVMLSLPGLDVAAEVLAVPGHTRSHVAYRFADALFCGDTLFSLGCGRLFEGTPGQMHASLTRLAELPADTRVYCAHEYTASNLQFAQAVEPDNPALAEFAVTLHERRAAGIPSIPSTIARERALNPFLRSARPELRAALATFCSAAPADPVGCFALLRRLKDHYRPGVDLRQLAAEYSA